MPSIYSSARTELAKLLIYGLFRKIRVLAQDGELCQAGTDYILIPMLPFAVELCLKGIKSQGGEFLWTHNLKSLWEDLDEVERLGVRKRVEDAAWRSEERIRREALDITGTMRTVDQVMEVHQNDFAQWRYVIDGERNLTEAREQVVLPPSSVATPCLNANVSWPACVGERY